jgi:hypothetical protein
MDLQVFWLDLKRKQAKIRKETGKFGFWDSGQEKRLKRWRCVRGEEGTDQDQGGLSPSPEKAYSSLCDIRFPSFLAWIEAEKGKLHHKKV